MRFREKFNRVTRMNKNQIMWQAESELCDSGKFWITDSFESSDLESELCDLGRIESE